MASPRQIDVIEGLLAAGRSFEAARYALAEHQSEQVPRILHRLWEEGRVVGENLEDAVAEAWTQNPSPERALGQHRWLALFKATGPIIRWKEKTASDGARVPAAFDLLQAVPTEPITVWRGASLSRARAMAWTVHRGCGRNFAEDWADLADVPSGLFRATIPPRAVLALFGDELEQEVVVNPNMLRGRIALVEEVTPRPKRPHPVFGRLAG